MRRRDEARGAQATTLSPTAHRKAALLRALGRSPSEPAIFSLPSPLMPMGAIVCGILLVLAQRSLLRNAALGIPISLVLASILAALALFPRRLVVGEDGLLISWLGTRFIPFVDIAQVSTVEGFYFRHPGVSILLRSGRLLDVTTSVWKDRWAERDALFTLIRTAAEDFKALRQEGPPEMLVRRGRSHLEWARSLRHIGSGANLDPRTPPVPADRLLRIAESPVAPLDARTAAFVVLTATEDKEIHERLRIAAELTAAPQVQAALQGALDAEGDESSLAEVLAYAEDRQARR